MRKRGIGILMMICWGVSAQAVPKPFGYKAAIGSQGYQGLNQRTSFPITYNDQVKKWIVYFQTKGKPHFKLWLERSHRYLPQMKYLLGKHQLPKDLAYIPLIESGFASGAKSHAQAVGYWQFIRPTANRYHLKVFWWLDERRDF